MCGVHTLSRGRYIDTLAQADRMVRDDGSTDIHEAGVWMCGGGEVVHNMFFVNASCGLVSVPAEVGLAACQ